MNRPCLTPGCGWPTPNTRCPKHTREYRNARWEHPAFKAWAKPNGRCVLRILCDGVPADTWDHIDGDATNHALSNRQPACRRCNAAKGGN